MKRILSTVVALLIVAAMLAGCGTSSNSAATAAGSSSGAKEPDTITIAWLPNNAGEDFKNARTEIENVIAKATGKKVEEKLTTDYAILVEAMASGTAQIAFSGAEQYIEAHNKNPKVVPLVVNSGNSGTLDDAMYWSRLVVLKGNEDQYKSGSGYAIDKFPGKKMSFVSNSSTSGFKVPTSYIVSVFNKQDKYKSLTANDLIEGGPNKFFSQVLFGGSHQLSLVNVLKGNADIAAVDDTDVASYVDLASGTANTEGAVYTIKQGAADPFGAYAGKQFVVLKAMPVMNGPFYVNSEVLSQDTVAKITAALTAAEVTNDTKIFRTKDDKSAGFFNQPQKFVKVEDAWFDPIRKLSE